MHFHREPITWLFGLQVTHNGLAPAPTWKEKLLALFGVKDYVLYDHNVAVALKQKEIISRKIK